MFSKAELEYLHSQPLARLATVGTDLQPDVVPVGFEFDGNYFYIGGHELARTRKHRNVRAGNTKVALVIDDLKSIQPWRPRGIRVYGTAEIVERAGRFGAGLSLRIVPETSWSWGLEELLDGGRRFTKKTHSVRQPAVVSAP